MCLFIYVLFAFVLRACLFVCLFDCLFVCLFVCVLVYLRTLGSFCVARAPAQRLQRAKPWYRFALRKIHHCIFESMRELFQPGGFS